MNRRIDTMFEYNQAADRMSGTIYTVQLTRHMGIPYEIIYRCCRQLASAHKMVRTHRFLSRCGLLRGHGFVDADVQEALNKKHGRFQSLLATKLEPHLVAKLHIESVLRPRADRWIREGLITIPAGTAVRRARRILDILSRSCPACVVWAVIKTWFNGWTTGRRFQQHDAKCLLCSQCGGQDSIEHYLKCRVVTQFAARKLRLNRVDGQSFMLFDLGSSDETALALRAVLLYATFMTTNNIRAHARKPDSKFAIESMWLSVRPAALQSRALRRILASMWQ